MIGLQPVKPYDPWADTPRVSNLRRKIVHRQACQKAASGFLEGKGGAFPFRMVEGSIDGCPVHLWMPAPSDEPFAWLVLFLMLHDLTLVALREIDVALVTYSFDTPTHFEALKYIPTPSL